jgi:Mrp family chromosome partitioning ATPase
MYSALFSMVLAVRSPATPAKTVAEAQRKCVEASKEPALHRFAQLPVEKFDECIVTEANKWPPKTRKAICALGKSGGAFGSTVEVYLANGKCRTDYE